MGCWVAGAGATGVMSRSRALAGWPAFSFFSMMTGAGAFMESSRNMEPTPGIQRRGIMRPEKSEIQPMAAKAGRWPMRMVKLHMRAPALPPAPTMPATPPTAVGSMKGTRPNTVPSVAARKKAHTQRQPRVAPSPLASLVSDAKMMSITPMGVAAKKLAQILPRTPYFLLRRSERMPPAVRANRLKRPKREAARPASACSRL
mmetsp:Transcript_43502/g.85022  ORF Transcript_43502/g.85022 Transcript_43502/m.85022 type:complete len:202 (+) Transcript_43502:393-998(+)